MQDPNADTEWNDILRNKGILPPKEDITEDDIVNMVEQTIQQKTTDKDYKDMSREELDDLEDDIDENDERIFEEYRRKRMMEMMEQQKSSIFGSVLEITKADWVDQVNKAGENVWVIVHVYKESVPLCKLVNQHLSALANKFPMTKFIKSVSSVCIPNYPDKNLPTIFVYHNGDMKKQWVGPLEFGGMNLKCDELEWMLGEVGSVPTELEENPRKKVHDVMQSTIRGAMDTGDDDENDW